MRKNNIIFAVLGVIIGVLITCVSMKYTKSLKTKVSYSNWRKLNLILEKVQQNYVDTVDVAKVTDAAVVAALAELDPHSVYLPPTDLEKSQTELAGNFDGIGIQFNVPNDTAIVLEVIPGGPSEKVGLMPGDRILKVGDKNIAGVKCPQDSMVSLMRGPAGTKVDLFVKRNKDDINFEITRGKIPMHCVDASFMINDTTGYVRLSKFSRNTVLEVSAAATSLQEEGMKRLILDLRDNTGGYLDQALLLADLFLERNDEIVFLKGKHRKREEYKASGKGFMKDVELSVLINESSASSSEIFAGAIQDNDRGIIVGRRSFGKGMVQEPIFFTDGSGVRITVARFYTPSGRCIQKPYDSYSDDLYKRYEDGEMFDSQSIKVDSSEAYKTVGGRIVYGGGGIIPDVFVPIDTTKVTQFYLQCSRKAATMRFASEIFDIYKDELMGIDDYGKLETFLSQLDIKGKFLNFAAKDGITVQSGDWNNTKAYLEPQIRALISRYSKLGDNAFYKMYLPTDDVIRSAVSASSKVILDRQLSTEQ